MFENIIELQCMIASNKFIAIHLNFYFQFWSSQIAVHYLIKILQLMVDIYIFSSLHVDTGEPLFLSISTVPSTGSYHLILINSNNTRITM